MQLNAIEQLRAKLAAEGKEPLNLSDGNPNAHGFIFPGSILEAAYGRYFREQGYTPHSKGEPTARAAIADYYRNRGMMLDIEHILITSGTSESFVHLFRFLGEAGDEVLVPCPAYPLFEHLAQVARLKVRHYLLREDAAWGIDLDVLEAQITPRTRGIVIISPNNPTGSIASVEELAAIGKIAARHRLAIIADEVFCEFTDGVFPTVAQHATDAPLIFTLNGISKMFALPAMKLGWIALSGADANRVQHAVDALELMNDLFLSCHIPIQWALPDMFSEGAEFFRRYHREVSERRAMALRLLVRIPGVSLHAPIGGFSAMLSLPHERFPDEEALTLQLMREHGISVHPGYFYDYERGCHLVVSTILKPERLRFGAQALHSGLVAASEHA